VALYPISPNNKSSTVVMPVVLKVAMVVKKPPLLNGSHLMAVNAVKPHIPTAHVMVNANNAQRSPRSQALSDSPAKRTSPPTSITNLAL